MSVSTSRPASLKMTTSVHLPSFHSMRGFGPRRHSDPWQDVPTLNYGLPRSRMGLHGFHFGHMRGPEMVPFGFPLECAHPSMSSFGGQHWVPFGGIGGHPHTAFHSVRDHLRGRGHIRRGQWPGRPVHEECRMSGIHDGMPSPDGHSWRPAMGPHASSEELETCDTPLGSQDRRRGHQQYQYPREHRRGGHHSHHRGPHRGGHHFYNHEHHSRGLHHHPHHHHHGGHHHRAYDGPPGQHAHHCHDTRDNDHGRPHPGPHGRHSPPGGRPHGRHRDCHHGASPHHFHDQPHDGSHRSRTRQPRQLQRHIPYHNYCPSPSETISEGCPGCHDDGQSITDGSDNDDFDVLSVQEKNAEGED